MNYKNIQQIAIIYGKKGLVEEFIEQFHIDRKHDGAPLNAVLVNGERKKELKRFIWKGN
jgi:hypothetical protein